MIDVALLRVIEPALGRVVLRMLPEAEVSDGGIILPNRSESSTYIGVVERTCRAYRSAEDDEDRITNGPLYTKGDVVVINKYTGTELSLTVERGKPRERFIICFESDIICTLREVE